MKVITSTMSFLAASAVRGSPKTEIKLPGWLITVRSKYTEDGEGNAPKNHTLYSLLENHSHLPGPWFSMNNQKVNSADKHVSWRTFQ